MRYKYFTGYVRDYSLDSTLKSAGEAGIEIISVTLDSRVSPPNLGFILILKQTITEDQEEITDSQGISTSLKWRALIEVDQDILNAFERIREINFEVADEFAEKYLVLNDKQYLSKLLEKNLELATQRNVAVHKEQERIKEELERKRQETEIEQELLEKEIAVKLNENAFQEKRNRRNKILKTTFIIIIVALVFIFNRLQLWKFL